MYTLNYKHDMCVKICFAVRIVIGSIRISPIIIVRVVRLSVWGVYFELVLFGFIIECGSAILTLITVLAKFTRRLMGCVVPHVRLLNNEILLPPFPTQNNIAGYCHNNPTLDTRPLLAINDHI